MANVSLSSDDHALSSFTTAHAAAVVVFLALAALIAIRHGFRGIGVGGASVRVG